jgi:hypothetical protein
MGNTEGFQIRTPDQRLRVFISSTIKELAAERRAVREAIEGMRLHPVLFELGARPHPPRDLYRAYLEQSDIFIGIYFESYGWIAPEMEISGLEDELVLSGDKPRLVYIKEPAPEREERLTGLLDRIQASGSAMRVFKDPDELKSLVATDLAVLLTERFTRPDGRGRHPGRLKTRVPSAAAPIVGREREISELTSLLADPEHRLVSMCGPGGVGKSRLAIEVANRLEDRFADGAHFVALEAVSRPDGVPDAIAASLGLADRLNAISPTDLLIKSLADRELLLVLDNFEHVIDAAPFLSGLLQSCPKVRVLVTTRTVLRLRAEAEYVLEPLDVPREGSRGAGASDSVRLFMERARNAAFATRTEQMRAVEEICRRLDGLPLAIELAAARTSILSPEQIVARLDDRFGFLKGGTADLPERHKTMRDAIAWSVDLLGTKTGSSSGALPCSRRGSRSRRPPRCATPSAISTFWRRCRT